MMRSVGFIALLIVTPLVSASINVKSGEAACVSEDIKNRAQLQNKLAGICESMCKEVEAYPKCNCPDFVPPDATPGVMTWDELLAYMDQLADWGRDSIKGWHKQASQLQVAQGNATKIAQGNATKIAQGNATKKSALAAGTCTAEQQSPSASLQAGGMPHMVYDEVKFCGVGQLKKMEGDCPDKQAFDE